jgi:hypothetical protein
MLTFAQRASREAHEGYIPCVFLCHELGGSLVQQVSTRLMFSERLLKPESLKLGHDRHWYLRRRTDDLAMLLMMPSLW